MSVQGTLGGLLRPSGRQARALQAGTSLPNPENTRDSPESQRLSPPCVPYTPIWQATPQRHKTNARSQSLPVDNSVYNPGTGRGQLLPHRWITGR